MSILGPAAIAFAPRLEFLQQISLRITRWPSHITTPRTSAGNSYTTSTDASASGREPVFADVASADLELVNHQALDGRVLLVEYRPSGRDIPRV
jgi:hypothetical protein